MQTCTQAHDAPRSLRVPGSFRNGLLCPRALVGSVNEIACPWSGSHRLLLVGHEASRTRERRRCSSSVGWARLEPSASAFPPLLRVTAILERAGTRDSDAPGTCLRGGVVTGREACGGHTGAPFSLRDRGPFPWPVSWENPDSHPGFARRSDSCSTSSWGSRGNESPQSTGATSVFGWPWGVSPQNVTLAILTVFKCTVLGH